MIWHELRMCLHLESSEPSTSLLERKPGEGSEMVNKIWNHFCTKKRPRLFSLEMSELTGDMTAIPCDTESYKQLFTASSHTTPRFQQNQRQQVQTELYLNDRVFGMAKNDISKWPDTHIKMKMGLLIQNYQISIETIFYRKQGNYRCIFSLVFNSCILFSLSFLLI